MDYAKPLCVKDGQGRGLGFELPWAYHDSWARISAGNRAGLCPFGPPAKVRIFHGGNTGSNPVGDANIRNHFRELAVFGHGPIWFN